MHWYFVCVHLPTCTALEINIFSICLKKHTEGQLDLVISMDYITWLECQTQFGISKYRPCMYFSEQSQQRAGQNLIFLLPKTDYAQWHIHSYTLPHHPSQFSQPSVSSKETRRNYNQHQVHFKWSLQQHFSTNLLVIFYYLFIYAFVAK